MVQNQNLRSKYAPESARKKTRLRFGLLEQLPSYIDQAMLQDSDVQCLIGYPTGSVELTAYTPSRRNTFLTVDTG